MSGLSVASNYRPGGFDDKSGGFAAGGCSSTVAAELRRGHGRPVRQKTIKPSGQVSAESVGSRSGMRGFLRSRGQASLEFVFRTLRRFDPRRDWCSSAMQETDSLDAISKLSTFESCPDEQGATGILHPDTTSGVEHLCHGPKSEIHHTRGNVSNKLVAVEPRGGGSSAGRRGVPEQTPSKFKTELESESSREEREAKQKKGILSGETTDKILITNSRNP
ncbi:hypothetical protein K438DRAFT_322903 [Mycena galopus ATCC 62051]|nr:hypothetical protein K438DRAFT_322903 [Mycena galopus ATCC 62051]